jgi:hypothetical protein
MPVSAFFFRPLQFRTFFDVVAETGLVLRSFGQIRPETHVVPDVLVDWSKLGEFGFDNNDRRGSSSSNISSVDGTGAAGDPMMMVTQWIDREEGVPLDKRRNLNDATNSCTTVLRKLGLTPMSSLYADFVEASPPIQQ